jgi:hypothetical protein
MSVVRNLSVNGFVLLSAAVTDYGPIVNREGMDSLNKKARFQRNLETGI